uniref:BTB domain-containing protein n=1 Tax=Meloidogyne hapla TaxID=6305 RepID=A0A1I8AXT2_MELHA
MDKQHWSYGTAKVLDVKYLNTKTLENTIGNDESFSSENNPSYMKIITCKLEWKFDKLKEIFKAAQFYIKTHLISNRFSIPEFSEVEWELIIEIYKKELISENDGSVGIWLRQIGPNTLNDFVNTKYKIYAIKNNNRVDISRSTNKLENQQKMGYSTFILRDVINSKGKGLDGTMIFEGSLYIYCEVKIACFNPIADLQNKYKKMLEEEIFTDCIFKVGDEIIKAHRCVLAQNNEVFKKMFGETGMVEAKNCEVTISDTTPECFHALLEYFYTGKINKDILEKHLDDIYAIAHKYQVETLKFECERYMSDLIGKTACKDFCRINRKSFFNSKEWKDVEKDYHQLGFKFMKFVINDLENDK